MRFLKVLFVAVLCLVVLLAVGITMTIGWRPFLGPRARPLTGRVFERTPQRWSRGKYLAESVSGCMDCHSPHDWTQHDAPIPAGMEGSGEDMATCRRRSRRWRASPARSRRGAEFDAGPGNRLRRVERRYVRAGDSRGNRPRWTFVVPDDAVHEFQADAGRRPCFHCCFLAISAGSAQSASKDGNYFSGEVSDPECARADCDASCCARYFHSREAGRLPGGYCRMLGMPYADGQGPVASGDGFRRRTRI